MTTEEIWATYYLDKVDSCGNNTCGVGIHPGGIQLAYDRKIRVMVSHGKASCLVVKALVKCTDFGVETAVARIKGKCILFMKWL